MTRHLHLALGHRYRSGFVLDVEFDQSLEAGGTTALVGASGSGKSTILRALAGLEPIDRGQILCDEVPWLDTSRGINRPPQQRDIGCLFQDYALFPHLNVHSNIAFGLRGKSRAERDRCGVGGVAAGQVDRHGLRVEMQTARRRPCVARALGRTAVCRQR